jgi:phosphoribosylamine--glycine ligase
MLLSSLPKQFLLMNILLLGSGGREHAFAWKIAQSTLCEKLFIAPGNPGTALCGTNVAIDINDFEKQEEFCLAHDISLIVVGPEEPLVNGVFDYFSKKYTDGKIAVIGPSKNGAQLEGSKAFAKEFMMRHQIPTAAYREFNINTLEEGIAYIASQQPPIVLKADGLAAGKGVVICPTISEAQNELRDMIGNARFGTASAKVVIEQFLSGIEFSVFVLTDGNNYKILPEAKDYKRIGEGDTGLNTGGMGAISPVPFFNEQLLKKVETRIIQPTIEGLKKENITYKGFIYFGLIKVDEEPFVIEYNCRMGDPETEIVLPRLKTDLVKLLQAVVNNTLQNEAIDIDERAAATVIVASGGYPGNYEKGKNITLPNNTSSIIFHAGTKQNNNEIVTNGGRVLAVTSLGENLKEAVNNSLNTIEQIHFEGMYFRKDIGWEF